MFIVGTALEVECKDFFLPIRPVSHRLTAVKEHYRRRNLLFQKKNPTAYSLYYICTVSEQFQSSFRAVSEQFQSSFKVVSEQFQGSFIAVF